MKKVLPLISKTTFIFLGLFQVYFIKAQTAPPMSWNYHYGGSGSDDPNCAISTSDGGYVLGGESQSNISGDKSQNAVGLYDYWIVKLDEIGVKQWDVTLGGFDYDYLLSIKQTIDGGYILGGYSLSGAGGDKTQPSQGDEDYWIVKVNANGVKEWDATFGGDSTDVLRSVAQTSDGGYILGGFSDSGMSGDKSQPSQGGRDYWIVKTDANGVKQWDKRFGGSDFDQCDYVAQTFDGGYVLGGFSASDISGDKSQGNQGYPWTYDYWIVKTDENGVKQWDARFGGTSYEYLYSMKQTADSGYILGGYSESGVGGDKSQPNWGSEDYWLVKLDKNANKLWDVRYGGFDNDYAIDIEPTPDGGYLFGGYSDSDAGGDKSQDNWGVLYTYDYWVVKTDSDGTKEWDTRYGGTNWDQLAAAFPTSDGGYFLAGFSNSTISGDIAQNGQGFDDYWVVKLACDSAKMYYADLDGDSYGNANNSLLACNKPKGYVSDSTDCDDTNALVYPGAPEIPGNGIDDDCDGQTDEIATGVNPFLAEEGFSIYPNPSEGNFSIRLNSNKEANIVRLQILNTIGQLIYQDEISFPKNKTVVNLNLTNQPNGIYFLEIILNDKTLTTQLGIQK